MRAEMYKLSKDSSNISGTKKAGLLLAFAFCSIIFSIPAFAAENVSDSIDISITVGSKTIVVVDPDSLSWTGAQSVDPGSEGAIKAIQLP
jgi:hypothetical protein